MSTWAAASGHGLYELLMAQPESRTFFPDQATLARVKRTQNTYFLGLFTGNYDLNYVRDRVRVGAAHERIGMPPKLYLGAYRRYLALIHTRLLDHFKGNTEEAATTLSSIRKIIFFDMALAIDTYIAAYLETMTRHQAAIRELSTPVIKVHDRILLLPIVGTVDTQRAHQIMETVLVHIVQEQAKVMILDIAGVPVVDTKVADHILKTTAAVQLLGAQTILTGISASVARTVVQLGVEITRVHTRANTRRGVSEYVEVLSQPADRHGDEEASEIRIEKEADIVAVRQRVRELAKDYRFDQFAVAALTTAASELSRNVWVHAQKGLARISVLRNGNRVGLELEFVDDGPGIADLNRALAGGFSTAKSLGLGLSGTKRLVDEFNIDTEPGRGTKIVIRKWKKEF